jgi:hypothetical protein
MTDGKMTTDLEKQFFSTFGIEPITQAVWDSTETKWKNFESWDEYPQITDRILLNLILIMNPYAPPVGDTMEEMKEQVLYWCIRYATEIKHQVRTLFEEG